MKLFHGSNVIVEKPRILVKGNITNSAFWELVKFKYPTHQIAFCTEKALATLKYEGSYKI